MTDLVETADYLAENDVEIAERFFAAFDFTIEFLKTNPKIGSIKRYRDMVDIRMWFIKGFESSLIFYTESKEKIVILRVLHASRDYTRFF